MITISYINSKLQYENNSLRDLEPSLERDITQLVKIQEGIFFRILMKNTRGRKNSADYFALEEICAKGINVVIWRSRIN